MNKLTILVIALLFVMSFVVESVTAAESTEVLRARLNFKKNNLKAVESKVDIASKVDVGVEGGVGNGVDAATKTAQGLGTQARLISKNSILRRAPADATASVNANANTNTVVNNNANGDATNPQSVPESTTPQSTTPQNTVESKSTADSTPESTPEASPQTPNYNATEGQNGNGNGNGQQGQTEQKVNYTAIIDEYMEQLRIKMEKQIEAMKAAMAAYREAERQHYISKTAKTLTHLQTCQEEIEKIMKAEEEFRQQQKKT